MSLEIKWFVDVGIFCTDVKHHYPSTYASKIECN